MGLVSEAEAEADTVPDTDAPEAGAVMLTTGGVLSTVTETAVAVAVFPDVSVAMALRLCWPEIPVVFQE
jgi:hypothetical protein